MVVETPGYQNQCQLWVPEGGRQAAPPQPQQPMPSAPDPALVSRGVTLAADLVESPARYLPRGSKAGGEAFTALTALCQDAVQRHGARGFTCFETAWRRAFRMSRVMEPDYIPVWMSKPIEALGDQKPLQLIRRGRATQVARLVSELESPGAV